MKASNLFSVVLCSIEAVGWTTIEIFVLARTLARHEPSYGGQDLPAALAAHPETRDRGIRLLRYGLYPWDTNYLALRYLLLGQALEEGDRAAAVRAYSRFVRRWENADPELQPRVETARRALERLTDEGTSP